MLNVSLFSLGGIKMYNNPYLTREQQPIQNIFTSQMPNQNLFMAKYLKEGETPQETFVNTKTALISLSKKELYIKELDGNITTYGIILPVDEKDAKIQALEEEVNNLKEMISNVATTSNDETNDDITKPNTGIKKIGRK